MKILEGQTLLDIAIQECGMAEACLLISEANGISITDDFLTETETEINIPENAKSNRSVSYFLKKEGLFPATAITATTDDSEGIDFWAIEDDFVIGVSEGIDFDEIEYDFIIEM